MAGILTLDDIDKAKAAGQIAQTVGETCTRDVLVTYPDGTLGAARRTMGGRDVGRLPVVAREDPRHLVGLLRRTALIPHGSTGLRAGDVLVMVAETNAREALHRLTTPEKAA